MPTTFLPAVAALRAAAEPTRLRLLALLARAELTVGEICEIVRQSQPRVSRHLKLLCDAGLIDRFREQHWVYYRTPASGALSDTVRQLLAFVREDDDLLRRDRKRLEQVIAERARRVAGHLPEDVQTEPSALIGTIVLKELAGEPIGVLLDVGTGAGHLLRLLGGQATRAVGIDISSDALRVARTKVHGAGLSHCELQRGDMYDLPFTAPVFDTVTADRVLARAERPIAVLSEMARTLRSGGRVVVIEDFDALAEASRGTRANDLSGTRANDLSGTRADDRRGNPIATLREWFARAGLECTRVHPIDTETGHLLVALARRADRTTAAA